MTRSLTCLVLLAVALTSCSRHHRELDVAKKEKLVAELVSTSKECKAFKEQLQSPTLKDDDVDAIYHAAMASHCINKDV